MNLFNGKSLKRISDLLFKLAGLSFILYITGKRYAYQGAHDLALIVSLLFSAGWIIYGLIKPSPANPPRFPGVILPVALVVILAAVNSTNLIASLGELKIWAVNFLVFIILANLNNPESMLNALMAVGIIYCSAKMPDAWTALTTGERITTPNVAAAFVAILFVISLAAILNSKASWQAWLSLSLSGIILLSTKSVGGAGGAIAGISIVAWLYLANNNTMPQWAWAIILVVVLAVVAFILFPRLPSMLRSLRSRFVIWEQAWELFITYPILGAGPGTFVNPLKHFNKTELKLSRLLDPHYKIKWIHPHSLYLAILSQLGLAGFVVFILALTLSALKISSCDNPWIAAAAAGSLAAVLAHGLLDLTLFEPYVSRAAIIPVALVFNPSCQNGC